MKFSARLVLIPVLLAGVAVPAAALPAAADSGPGAVPVLTAGNGPADKNAVVAVRPTANGQVTPVQIGDARLTDYDAGGGHALLSGRSANGLQNAGELKAGDVIASPATAAVPHGALVRVVAVHPQAGGAVRLDTTRANLTELLGDAKADLRTPLTAADLKAKSLAKGGHASVGESNGRGIRIDVNVPMPSGVTPTQGHASALSGWLELRPELLFAYERAHWYSVAPSKAKIGFASDYNYGFAAHAEGSASYDTGHRPLHIPAAEVDVNKTVWLGPVPIVLNLKVDYFYDISANGKITIDAEQRTDGRLEVGGVYDANRGWTALSGPDPVSTGTAARIEGSATAKSGVGTHTQVGLYGSVGVTADFMPYLKADAHGFTGSEQPQGSEADWALYAGTDLTGTFFAKLNVFGTKVLDKSWNFPAVNFERKLAGSDSGH
ncbi:hypothetical protein ACIQU6_33855 [Streptomyces sp. NPDC090442]|uniref:hypothetical protein n=1 Tax=Streptomyces sp. NPDC090442 TaxID=3365962 RepID=UPI00380BF946